MQSVVDRLRVIEAIGARQVEGVSSTSLTQARELMDRVFTSWSQSLESRALYEGRQELEGMVTELRADLDEVIDGDQYDERSWALLSGVRGLLQSMDETQAALQEIEWDRWTEVRF